MPGYKTHITGGLIAGGVALGAVLALGYFKTDIKTGAFLVGISLLGALFPDTDTDSKGQNLFYGILVVIDLYLLATKDYKTAAILGFCALLPALGHHRGWTHRWWSMLLVPFPILLLPHLFLQIPLESLLPYYFAAVIGYFSHLALDRNFF